MSVAAGQSQQHARRGRSSDGLTRRYTVAAGQAIANARRWQHSREIDEPAAFELLKWRSQEANIKLKLLAAQARGYEPNHSRFRDRELLELLDYG